MKCIRCNHDSKYPARRHRKCPACGGKFAFEPREGDKLTDRAFQNAIDAVSAHGRLRWGVEHLYYEVCRQQRRKALPPGCVIGPICGIVAGMILAGSGSPFAIALVAAGVIAFGAALAIGLSRGLAKTVRLTEHQFGTMWSRWQKVHGVSAGVIIRREKAPKAPTVEPDVGDYSFDRVVICDRARTVDLLLANNFHFENNCAVLSIKGYPPGPFEMVRTMLRRNPRLDVYALHDATPEGCQMAHHLAHDPAWFQGHAPVTDVGLRPCHAGPFGGLLLDAKTSVQPGDGLTVDEAQWLSQYNLELAAIRPEQVLKRLFRAINRKFEKERAGTVDSASSDGGSGTDVGVEVDSQSFAADAGDADGGADGFG